MCPHTTVNSPIAAGLGSVERRIYKALRRERLAFARHARQRGAPTEPEEPDEQVDDDDLHLFVAQQRSRAAIPRVPAPLRIAATLALARLADTTPGLMADLTSKAPIVLIDVPDLTLLEEVRAVWRGVLVPAGGKVLHIDKAPSIDNHDACAVLALVATEPVKPRDRDGLERDVLRCLAWSKPLVGLSPSATSVFPRVLLTAARYTLTLPGLDAQIVAKTVQLVTGMRCRIGDLDGLALPLDLVHLAVALRHDRDPRTCIAELQRLQDKRARRRGGRDLTLDELHGLDNAVTWARSLVADLAAWRRGDIGWDAVDHGLVLDGPPGTGKTLFARVLATATGLPLICGSLATWQSAGHLGDLLKAMRRDFDAVRAQSPAILFIDEIDAFGDRASMTHEHRDYSTQVVNGFLEQLDGSGGREGLVFVAASNDIRRCDPAIVRAGRLNRIVRIDLPDAMARAKMLRVRIGADLPDADLHRIARLAEGLSGADIEKLVKDARRAARQAGRPLTEGDLMAVAMRDDAGLPASLLYRVAVHEAGHAVLSALIDGTDEMTVALQSRDGAAGWVSHRPGYRAGTPHDKENEIVITLAGRAAEEALLGSVSAGAGGQVGSDLHVATSLAAGMVGSFGLAGPSRLLFTAPASDTTEILRHAPLRASASAILDAAYERACLMVGRHKAAVERVAQALVEKRWLDGATVFRLLTDDRHGAPPRHPLPVPHREAVGHYDEAERAEVRP